jgi:hypothetical protein
VAGADDHGPIHILGRGVAALGEAGRLVQVGDEQPVDQEARAVGNSDGRLPTECTKCALWPPFQVLFEAGHDFHQRHSMAPD